ncbi:pentapeptide repeat-containing protein [Neisseria elongata]|uniref:pentapeptide repeat-containing protein n=1 Tax=Neisseria elongata TaxID=495 RepID=UPI00195690C0|nr:pentapeptide repeat-containing protein [Neisseria elongata]MBM7065809.1 pentapeptide repeat-containing protein [Neisseria elongata]
MGNADYIWEQIGVWFAAYQRIIILLGCLIIVTSLVVWKRKKLVDVQKELTEKWTKFTNAGKVFWAGIASLVIFVILFIFFQICFPELMEKSAGLWNFIILVVSAPVAFAIWHFRDENNRQQIENQRKDINLKEFQKLSEWVSGAHLPEIKTIDKTTQKEGLKDKGEIDGELQLIERTTEKTEEYGKKPHAEGFDTFGKREGAVALQISAVYNLLPFFRGDYGESFRRPAFNLLKSAWQAMQQDSLKKWETENLSDDEQQAIIEELELKADSPMGVALTHVLLSLDQKNMQLNLRDFPEMLPNICLAGMNFHLSGVDEKARNWSGLDLSGVDFRGAHLKEVQFEESQLNRADLQNADLLDANLQNANLLDAKLQNAVLLGADLQNANLSRAKLQNADLLDANLQNANLLDAKLQNATLRFAELQNANLSRANLQHADLLGAKLQYADLRRANLQNADLRGCDLWWRKLEQVKDGGLTGSKITEEDFKDKIYPEWKAKTDSEWEAKTDSEWEALTKAEKMAAMQKFHDQTGIYIFSGNGRSQIIP